MKKSIENYEIYFEYVKTEVTAIYGGQRIESVYIFEYTRNGLKNSAIVYCEVKGLNEASVYMDCTQAIIPKPNKQNQETLTEDATIELMQDCIL